MKYAELASLKQSKRLKEQIFYTFDSECSDGLIGKQLFCCSITHRIQNKIYDTYLFNTIDEFMKYLENNTDEKNRKIIFCQYLSFDIRFIANYCAINGIVLHQTITDSNTILAFLNEYNVKFVDSLQFLQESQEMAELTYNVPEKFRKIDCKDLFVKEFSLWSNADKNRVREHNKNDVIALHIILDTFRKNMYDICNVDILQISTPASLGIKALRKTLTHSIVNPFIVKMYDKLTNKFFNAIGDREKEKFSRESYYGGRVECYTHEKLFNVFYVDIVSSYANSMRNNDYPDGIPFWETSHDRITEYLKNGKLCIIECDVITPKMNYPILPYRDKSSGLLLFPVGHFTGIYCSAEILYAQEKGYQLYFKRALIYPSKIKPFVEFVDKFMKVKNESTGGKRKGAKLLINAPYGKIGQKFEIKSTISEFYINYNDAMKKYNDLIDKEIYAACNHSIDAYYEVRYRDISFSLHEYQNVSLASFITCYSRLKLIMRIHELEKIGNLTKYCDSDSTVLEFLPDDLQENVLGFWALENSFE